MEDHGQKVKVNLDSMVHAMRRTGKQHIKSDTQGSYTGMTIDDDEPVQDADDL